MDMFTKNIRDAWAQTLHIQNQIKNKEQEAKKASINKEDTINQEEHHPTFTFPSIHSITPEVLQKEQIKHLLINANDAINDKVAAWIQQIQTAGIDCIVISIKLQYDVIQSTHKQGLPLFILSSPFVQKLNTFLGEQKWKETETALINEKPYEYTLCQFAKLTKTKSILIDKSSSIKQ